VHPINEQWEMDDAAPTIRQYVAALLPIFSGFFLESMVAKLAGATIVASNYANLTASRAILQAFGAHFLVSFP